MTDNIFENPWSWIAAAIAAAILIVALAYALPLVAGSVAIVIRAFTTGMIPLAAPGWLVTTSAIAVNIGLIGGGAAALKSVATNAKSKPLPPVIAVLAILQAFALDIAKELWPAGSWEKIAFKAISALLFLIAASIWNKSNLKRQILSLILFTLPLLAAGLKAFGNSTATTFSDVVSSIPTLTWISLGCVAAMAVAAILARIVLAEE